MDKEKYIGWLEEKIIQTTKYKPKDDMNKAYMLGSTKAMLEILEQVKNGKFDKQ